MTSQPESAADEDANLSRRGFLERAALLGLAAPGTALLSSCNDGGGRRPRGGNGNASGGGTLRVAYYEWIGNVAPWLEDLKTQFEEANDGVTVEYTPLAADITQADSLVQKFTLEARKGDATYDLILGPTPWIESGSLAKANAVANVDDLLTDEQRERIFEPTVEEALTPDGGMFSLPFWTDVVGFLSRPDLLNEYGATPPTSWSELSTTITAVEGQLPKNTFAYSADWAFIHRFFLPILVTLTDEPFADNGTIAVDTPEALQALEMIKELQAAMPPNADKNLGSSEVFQAGRLLMQTFWQAGYQRAQEAKLTPEQVAYTANLSGDRDGTVVWNTAGVVLANSPVPDLAVSFVMDGLLGDFGLEQAASKSGRICPVTDFAEIVDLPEWQQNAYDQIETGTTLPGNDAFLAVEDPTFQTEVQRMVIDDVSPEDTQKALASAFAEYEW